MKSLVKYLDLFVFSLISSRIKDSLTPPSRDAFAAYADISPSGPPESFFPMPTLIPDLAPTMRVVSKSKHYDVFDFHFPSAVNSNRPENDIVWGRYYETQARTAAPTVIVLHGWLAFSYLWFAKICRMLAKAGINAVLIQLPYHMDRQPQESRFSGELSINGDVKQTVEMVRQGVSDTRSVVNWVKSRGQSPVGVWGVSLGGWVGSLVTTVESRLDLSILMIPAVRPDDILWHSQLVPAVKEVVASGGITADQVEQALRIVTPKSFRPSVPPDKILLMEAEYDLGVRPHTVEELWEAWDRPHLRRYPHGHISIVFSRRALRDGVDFALAATHRRKV